MYRLTGADDGADRFRARLDAPAESITEEVR
jgi:hypothetical protein